MAKIHVDPIISGNLVMHEHDVSDLSATGTPSASTYLRGDGTWTTPGGSGDVVGPASAVDGNVVLFDTTTGKLIKDSGLTLAGNNTGDNATNTQYSGLASSKADVAQIMYIGTTAHAINRASATEGLAGITSLTPGANFTLAQNAVVPFTSVEAGAVANTLYLKEGNVGIGTTSPLAKLDVTDGHIRVKSLNLSNAFSQYRNDGPNLFNINNEGQLDGGIRGYVRINDNLSLSAGKWLQLGAGSLTFYGSGNDSKISHGSQFDGTTWTRAFNNYLTNVNFLSSITGTSIFFQSTDANSGTPSFSNRMRFYVDGAGTKGGQLTIGDGSDPVANLDVNIQDASTIGQVIKGATSQTANLQEWRSSSGTGLVAVTSAGNVGINVTAPAGKLDIQQTSTTAAIPTLILDQSDLSEEFIQFESTVGAGNPIDTAALGTYYGKIRISVNGTFKFMALYNT